MPSADPRSRTPPQHRPGEAFDNHPSTDHAITAKPSLPSGPEPEVIEEARRSTHIALHNTPHGHTDGQPTTVPTATARRARRSADTAPKGDQHAAEQTRRELALAKVEAQIRRAVETAPPLDAATKDRLRQLLTPAIEETTRS